MEFLLIGIALFLSFGNGANDNFKGFATVWGSETLSYRSALMLATVATVAGSLASLFLAENLVQQFSGKGLLPDVIVSTPHFILSIGIGATITVIMATRVGLPISTTHALIGGLIGAGLASNPSEVQFAKLWNTFMLPLLFSPIAAAMLGFIAYRLLRLQPTTNDCACVLPAELILVSESGVATLQFSAPRLVINNDKACNMQMRAGARFSITHLLDQLHILSAGLICFARGVNDTPKLAALLIAAHLLDVRVSIMLIAIVMALGGLMFARHVAETMSQRVTRMEHTQGVVANLITAALVLSASKLGLPVSTTHVSVGSIAGVGAGSQSLNWNTLRNILWSWVATLPMAAGIAWIALKLI
ncbi:inorganic phosphate transporter [Undibacterium griseum]|uniref:Inorganic phosphate transporter n=1 Tax=Undibacterium griseum TaxID=2762295 RepID=A0ABR6YJK4_9BURK|nr:inorganic phosphate transporter [Undibacterium griseum]MBC3884075.1 inorganic phosphate transporter [Undibacterium griseum]